MQTSIRLMAAAVLCAALSGCEVLDDIPRWRSLPFEAYIEPKIEDEAEAEPALAVVPPEPKKEEYTVFIENKQAKLGLYEPASGVYLGAYILSNAAIDYDIEQFEAKTGRPHALYSYYMSPGSAFPISWLLSCIAQYKTPNIVMKPSGLSIDEAALTKSARDIGEFHVPIFVQLAPLESHYDAEQYKAYFRHARKIFAQHAPNAAIVWTIKAEDAFDCTRFYPGDAYTNWVGISVYQTLTADKTYDPGQLSAFEHFYYSFHKQKPIMLAEYAVSHLSTLDSVYRASAAAAEISRMYGALPNQYPRVKAVTYMDVNGLNATSSRKVRDNFSLLEQPEISNAYAKAVAAAGYLGRVEDNPADVAQASQLIRSSFTAYAVDGELFIARATVEQDMNISGTASRVPVETIDGRAYFSASELQAVGVGRVKTKDEERVVVISR